MEGFMKQPNKNIRTEPKVFAMLTVAALAWTFAAASDAQSANPAAVRARSMSHIFTR